MSIKPVESSASEQDLSALVDGELDGPSAGQLMAQWRDDPGLRERWHCYQLIGDVLRSDDLASQPGRDSEFLARLRVRLASEAVVLAPEPLPAAAPAVVSRPPARVLRRRWAAPAAVAAGFVVVAAGALMMGRNTGSDAGDSSFASARPGGLSAPAVDPRALAGAVPVGTVPQANSVTDVPTVEASGTVIRDARLDRYFAAHQQAAGGSVFGPQATQLRRAAVEVPAR